MKRKHLLLLAVCVFAFAVIFAVYYYNYISLPKNLVKEYLHVRYGNTNIDNINSKINLQRDMLSKSLDTPYFKFANFDESIEYFVENNVHTELLNCRIYDINRKKNLIYVYAIATVKYNSDTNQESIIEYNLEFILKKEGILNYKIDYIKLLHQHSMSGPEDAYQEEDHNEDGYVH